jgi:hypothetical protein
VLTIGATKWTCDLSDLPTGLMCFPLVAVFWLFEPD